jgi:hypothetical protein
MTTTLGDLAQREAHFSITPAGRRAIGRAVPRATPGGFERTDAGRAALVEHHAAPVETRAADATA